MRRQEELRRTEQHVTRTTRVHGTLIQEGHIVQSLPPDGTPPVFEKIFSNARFAQGGNALFEGRVTGSPKPAVSWTRKGAPLFESNKYKMSYEEQTGNVSLLINQIGPGDEGEYTCTARNPFGEAICSVFIQPEGIAMPQQIGYQRETTQQTMRQQMQFSQTGVQQVQTGLQQIQTEQSQRYSNGYTLVEEDFKVDTFEYRLLREVSFRESLTRRYAGESDISLNTTVERSLGPPAPPKVQAKPRNSKISEGSDAAFVATIGANPKPRLTWFKNGKRIVSSQKHQVSYMNQQAILKINQVSTQDSGHYTLLAENPQGCVVSSAYLAVESSVSQDQMFEKEMSHTMEAENVEGKMIAPNIVKACSDREVTEGKMTRFECRVTGRPYPEVTWYINGKPVRDDATHKILVNESGNHALMITNVAASDSGTISCIARNKAGETSFQCKLNVIEKELVVAPKFVQRFNAVSVKEGEPFVLTARAVGTPVPNITWQKDGVPIMSGDGVNIITEGGVSRLEAFGARLSDAGWYQCTAQNMAGSTATRARVHVQQSQREPSATAPRLHLPTPTTVIQPEPMPEPEVIYLKHVERAAPRGPRAEEEKVYPPPQFIIPLKDTAITEGGKVHLEARVEPVGDPSMRIDWYHNGKPLPAGSRITSTFRFGFLALDILNTVAADMGDYVCVVSSASGTVQSVAKLTITERASIEQKSQYPESLAYITQLEDYSKYQRSESFLEEETAVRPEFIRPLRELGQLQEGRNAHFEAQLTPVSDPTMRVDWYKDGRPITASSRITTIFNFGYVSLNILHLRSEDSGVYTVRAVNRWGEAVSQSTLQVIARSSVTGDLGIPEQQRYIHSVEALEAHHEAQWRRAPEPPESTAPPVFRSPIKDQLGIREGGFAHFEARLEPVGDSTLRVEWLKDGRPVEASSRITTFFNFGYVALTIKSVTVFDKGHYTCYATNALGKAETSAQLGVISKQDIIIDSQHPGGLQKIQTLEDSSRYQRMVQEETTVTQKPRFLGPLKGTTKIVEGQRAHFEARVEPLSDTTMKIEWYFNGKVLMSANRIQTYHDFGYVSLDIMSVRAEDAGTYTVVARNALGEVQLSASMQVETRSSIDTRSMHHGAYDKTRQLEEGYHVEPHYDIEEISKSKPIFVVPLSDPKPVSEGKNIHLECRLEPMGDPTMRVEWFHNGKPITVGSRFRTYYDFGYVVLDIIHVTSLDSGEYTVRATNHLGSSHTSACVRVLGRSDIVTETQNESALEQIQFLEDSSRHRRHVQEDVTIVQPPVFTRPLHNIETIEGTNIHLECRLQPVGDPSMRVEWFVNGVPVKTGHRFRPAYDFDYVALDLLSVYPDDSGVYTCQARNQLGEAVTSCSVKIIAKKDLILESQHPGGLEKIQYLEDASRYRKTDMVDEFVTVKPRFLTKPKSVEMREGGHAHFECKLEPVTDSSLKVEWYKNGRPIIVGHRFRPIHDFGYVALDIVDLIAEDSGTYTCRAVNLVGADETACSLSCKDSARVLTETQNEMGLEQIQFLEDRSRYQRTEIIDEMTRQAPVFTTSLKQCDIKEAQRAHFEARLIPVSDTTMKVEWFHNNKPVKSGSRFTETNNFGYVALDIFHCLPEDSGTYTCRAKNVNGEAVTSSTLNVQTRQSIYLESQHQSALTRLSKFEERKYTKPSGPEDAATQAPVFTQPAKNLRTSENQPAHFEARLIPVGDPRLKVEWLRNGVPITASNRVTTMHDFGYVALNMKYVYAEDSGTYTCRAINDLGQAVTSATLDVQSKASLLMESQHEGALQKLQALEDSSRYARREDEEVIVTQKPNFSAKLNGPSQLLEGQSAHYECRIEPYPDPNLRVEWFHNGKPLQTGHRFRTTNDFGFASLDILTVYSEDTGEYTCKAINKLGEASSSVKLNVKSKAGIIRETQHEGALQKIQYLEDDSRYKRTTVEETTITEKPEFGRPLKSFEHLPEGKPIHLEATLTPVNDPTMKVEWFWNGRPVPQGHRFKTTYDFGFVALDILYAYSEDSGTYMCKATNVAGEAVTTCSISIDSKAGLQLNTLDEQRLKKIQELEHFERPQKAELEPPQQKPVFITPLNNLENLKEGEHAHLECRVEPINDPNLKVEWFVNGVPIKTGHRFRTTHDFGYVALDILYVYAEDSGTYMCKATNLLGEAVNTCNIKVQSRRSILLDTQHPDGLEKIRELEAQGHPARLELEEPEHKPPSFVTELRGTTEIAESKTAHFEAQIEPLHDPNLRVEVYHNGKPLPSASRFHITFDFGYFALDIGHAVPDDAGEYTVKAINKLGSCVSSTSMRVLAKDSIILESQRPEGLEKIRQLEATGVPGRPEVPEAVTRQRPVFTQPLQNIDTIAEGQTAHFECRLIPVGDPTLKVEWFRNDKHLEDSSRITKTHDFGFVSMDMTHVRPEDEGVYMCRAYNALGEAVTTASMKIKTKADIQMETQHPEGMRRIQELESGREPHRRDEPDLAFEKPIFTQLLTGPAELWEGQRAHYEARVVPVGDPTMHFQWYVNGVELKMGSRFHTTHDFGFVTLDITSTVPEDSGVYTCKAMNAAGEAVSSTSLKIRPRSAIAGEPLQPDAWQKIQLKEAQMQQAPEGIQEVTHEAPVFTKHLTNVEKLVEGAHVYLEAQVEPKTDPNLRIEWYKNGASLTTGTRIKTTFDFGLVTLSVNGVRPDDSGIYTCKATNLHGEAVSTCTIKVEDRHWLLANSLRPEALPLIDALEGPKEGRAEIPEPTFEGPVFISHLNNVVCNEGENAHFECRVEPAKDPTLKIEFFVNGKPLPTGARFKGTHDFGYVAIDINSSYAEDSGIYMVKATNSKGQASTSGSLRCTSKDDIFRQTQHPQGEAGLEKVQEVDDAYASKLQRQTSAPETEYAKPVWVTPLSPEFKLGEAQPLHLEGLVTPKEDPNLKIEWFFNGKALSHGSRFKMTSEFGFVTLDLVEVYERDQGIYTCKAWNKKGEAYTSTTVYCTSKEGLVERTQHPKGEEGLGKIQELEESLRKPDEEKAEKDEGHPPEFTSQFQNLSNVTEGEIAHFEASLTPVGDQTMKVEWFFNGKTLEASHRTRTVHAFGMVVLEILGTKIEDSGTYTCRATNKWGQAEISVNLECVDVSKGQKPQFTTQIQSVGGLKDGDSAHFECTLIPVGDPTMKVEWFHNGKPIRHSTRIKQVSDFGFVVMDVAYTQGHDSGEYVCRATNKYGEDTTRATLDCVGKGGVYFDTLQPDSLSRIRELEAGMGVGGAAPSEQTTNEPPKFTTHFSDIASLKEGQSAHFEARLIPVNDPNLVVEWYFNGKKLPHGHRYRTFHDFGIVILDILYCYAENSGVYECRAKNLVGSDMTKATLKCSSKAGLILESQLPQGMEGGLEKIQTLEDSMIRTKDEKKSEEKGQAPVFTVPLANIDSLREGENAHFEGRLLPTDDPKLKVEWFWNNKPLRTGSRFRTFCDFGFVILEISPVYPEDSGEYSCRASNDYGQAVTTSVMKVQGKRSIILESQLPKGMEGTIGKIAELEGLGGLREPTLPEDDIGKPPEFVTTPTDQSLIEFSLAHFECRLTPINDPSMRVEWFHNGKPLLAGSRIKTIHDFGFVILEIDKIDTRDTGLYTCKATNRHGEAIVSCKLQVKGRQGIILEPQLPHTFSSGTESIQKLEETLHKKDEMAAEDEKPFPPNFIVELKDAESQEGGAAHFDCRVEPAADPTLTIDWFFNGRPFATGSRVHMLNDFGFIVLDMQYVYARDTGEYICRATNRWGTATTKAKLVCKAKHDVVFESQLPAGMSGEKLKELEKGHMAEPIPEQAQPQVPPKFITQISSATVGEAEPVRFECRVEPKNDPTMRIEWYRNGKILPSGHRYRTVFDMGFVSLDILYVYPEDSGEYVCRAVNNYGEDFTKATISCKKEPSIILQNQVPKGMKKSEALMQMEATIKKYTSEVHLTEEDLYEPEKKQPPRFVTQIMDQTSLVEMEATKFECQLAPVGDPNMKVEWFFNGKPLPHKNRFTPIYDFGYVAMNFGWVYPEDSGEYLCRATNLYGMDETKAIIRTTGKPGIIYESQLPKGMKSIEKIREMEASWQIVAEEKVDEEKVKEAPVFVSKPDPTTVAEGDCARFCCRVTGYPRPRVMWLINNHTVVNGTRYKLTYDGMWHLDIPKTRQYDDGKVEVVARNSAGESRVETVLHVKPREDDFRGVLKNSPRQIVGTKEYRKPEWVTDMELMQAKLRATQAIPRFIEEVKDCHNYEDETVVFECQFSGNPLPVVRWYHDDKAVHHTENVKVSTTENRTKLTIIKVKAEDAGTYTCRAVSDIGMATSRAKLNVIGSARTETEEEVVIEEVVEKKEKKKKKKRKTHVTVQDVEREPVELSEVLPLETTTQFTETTETVMAEQTFDVQESVSVSAVASCKKISDQEEPLEAQVAGIVAPIQEAMSVTEAITEETTGVTLPWKHAEETKGETVREIREAVTIEETLCQASAQEITTTTTTTHEVHATMTEKKLTTAKVTRTQVKTSEVEEILDVMKAEDFGPGMGPLRELATIDVMMRNGVTVEEVVSLYQAEEFPALRAPDAQSALVSLVERQGQAALLSQYVSATESVEETLVGVFKAFMVVATSTQTGAQEATTVREVLPLFTPEDFRPRRWDHHIAMPVIAEETATETITEIKEVETQEIKKKSKKEKHTRQEVETEGEATIQAPEKVRAHPLEEETPQKHETVTEIHEGELIHQEKVEEDKTPKLGDQVPSDDKHPEEKKVKPKKKKQKPKEEEEVAAPEKLVAEKAELKPIKLERKEVKPTKMIIEEQKEQIPLFATVKLKKPSIAKKEEAEAPKVPKVLLKSRITRIEYPPAEKSMTVTEMEVLVDSGILSRNYEESKRVKKRKPKTVKLSDLERPELEKYSPEPEDQKRALPEEKDEVKKPTEAPKQAEPLEEKPKKLKLGKGKVPESESVPETVTLKKVKKEPQAPEEGKEPGTKKPKQGEYEKPKEAEDVDQRMEPIKPFDTEERKDSEKDEPTPEKTKEEEKPKVKKTKKVKSKPEKEEEEPEERKLVLGKPKEKVPETEEEVSFKKKQGVLPQEEPEKITLKPFKKEKPKPEETEKDLEAGKPKPFDYEREEEEVQPEKFTIDDTEKAKKKLKKKRKPEDDKKEEVDEVQPIEEPSPEKVEEKKPIQKKPKPEKMEIKQMEQKAQQAEEFNPKQPFSLKLKKVKAPEKKEDKPKELPKFLLKSRIKRIEYPPKLFFLTITEMEPAILDSGILSRNYKEAEKVIKKKPKKTKLPGKPERDVETVEPFEEIPKEPIEKEPEILEKEPKKVEKAVVEEEVAPKLVLGKGKVPELVEEKEVVKLRKIEPKEKEETEMPEKVKKPKSEDEKKEKPKREYDESELKPLPDIEFSERPDEEAIPSEKPLPEPEALPEEKVLKKPKTKRKKEKEESPERKLVMGVPKKKPSVEEEEIKFRKPKSEKPEEEAETVKLKPFEKEKPKEEDKPTDDVFIGEIPKQDILESDIQDREVTKKIKKKKKPEEVEKVYPEEEKVVVPDSVKKEKPIPQVIERKEMKSSKMKAVEVKLEQPSFTTVKLRKASVTPKQEPKKDEKKKFLLKSRIVRIEFPSAEKKPSITEMPKVTLDSGVLSRNYKEAEKVLKKKPKKVKLPEKEEVPLEKYEPFKEEKEKPDEVEEKTIRKPQKPEEKIPEEVELLKIKLGKGKIIESEVADETVKLKPFKKPTAESEEIEEVEAQLTLPKKKLVEEETVEQSISLKPRKERVFVEEPESDLIVKLIPQKKPTPEDVSEEITIKKPDQRKPLVEEVCEEITIIKKDKPVPEQEEEVKESVTIKKKKTKKPLVTEDVSQEVVILRKDKPSTVEEVEEVILLKKEPKSTPVETISTEEVITLRKATPKPFTVEEVEEEITITKEIPEEVISETISIGKKKPFKTTVVQEVSEEITLKAEKPKPKFVTEEVTGEELVIKKIKEKETEYKVEEVSGELTIEKKLDDEDEEVAVVEMKRKVIKQKPGDEELTEELMLKPKKKKPQKMDEPSEEITLKKPGKKPQVEEVEEVVQNITFVPKKTKKTEEVEQEFKIQMKTYEEEEIAMSGKVKLPRKKKPMVASEEAASETIYIQEEVEEGPEDVRFPLRRKSSTTAPYKVEEVEAEVQLGLRRPRTASVVTEEESLDIKLKRKPSKPIVPTFHQEEAYLHITRETEVFEEEQKEIVPIESREGDILFSICTYVAETEDALNLVEGERVYVIESHNSDWWFVKKNLTEEKGWVPAVYLRDEPSYTLYVQKKLHEKIDKLPIFEKPSPGAEVFAPRFVEKLQPKHAPDGTTVQFECQVEGNPRPQITWFRQTAIIKPSHDFQIFYDDDNVATLIINEVFPEDAGTFTCVAKNTAGFASSTTELVVETPLSDHGSDITSHHSRKSLSRESSLADILEGIPPTFSRKPKAHIVEEGSSVELEVRLVAVPEPDVTWLRDGKQLKESEVLSIVTRSDMHMYSSIVTIKKARKDDEGCYTVTAKNREGEATLDITLKVKTGKPEAPVVVEPLFNASVSEGETVVLTTQVTGEPTPKVTWLRDGSPLKEQKSISSVGDTHSLTLVGAKPNQAGHYTVKASNKHGSAESTAVVSIEELPHPQAPLFVERFEEQNVREKGTIRLVAKVVGNPIPNVTWFRNNKILLASPRITEMFDGEQIVLEIIDADSEEDAGDYKCVASNSVGTTTHGARVTVDVEKVSFTKLLPSSVKVKETETTVIECETSHTVSTTWSHNGKELSGMDNREIVQEGRKQRLVIKKASTRDKGVYTCSVKDQLTTTKLIVQEVKPYFVRTLEDFEVKEQECAILEVETSSETAEVVWKKDGMNVEARDGKVVMEKTGNVRKLLIRSTSVHDEGEYTCQLGDQECTAEVTVIELPPEILTKMQDTTVARGEKAGFEVELTKGDALVRWFKDDKELQFSEHVQLSIDGKRQRLRIYQSEDIDAGVYSCRVGDQVSTARLTVEEPKVEFVTRLPDVTMLPVGADAEFTIELSRSDVEVKWLKKGKEIKQSKRCVITSDGAVHTLHIKKVTTEDQSEYTCIAMNVKTSTKLKIEVLEMAPKIELGPKQYSVKKGEDVTFQIKFSGTPTPKDEWSVNGNVIIPSKRVSTKLEEGFASLTIKKVEEADTGNYTVKLKNNVGEASAELTLIIIEVPGAPGAPEIVESDDSSITVHWKAPEYDGNSPIISYILEYHDKEEFMTWHKIQEITEITHKVTGLIKDHEVTFRVSALNLVGQGICSNPSAYGRVASPKSSTAPVIQQPLADMTVGLGKSATLTCVFSGVPTPDVKWLKDGKAVKVKTVSFINNVAKLTLENCSASSSGKYTCKATNTAGTVETSCKLIVQDVPELTVEDEMLMQRLRVSSQWKPTVHFTGFPRPEICWTKDGNEISKDDKRIKIFVDETSTTIAIYSVERQDTGEYVVSAKNVAGSALLKMQLRVIDGSQRAMSPNEEIIDKPSKPEAVLIQDVDAESVMVEWQPPADDGGVDISKYSLEKCEVGKMIWTKVADIERSARSYTVQHLQTDSQYMFRLFAQNPVGVSEATESDRVTVRTKLGKPSAPNGPLVVFGVTDTSCTIGWEPPTSNGGSPIIDYIVERNEVGKKEWTKVGITAEQQIIISDMKKDMAYEFRITARNKVGMSPPYCSEEPVIAGKKKTPPSPPVNLIVANIASKSVQLQWSPPNSNGGSELTGYVVEKQPVDSSKWTKVVTLDPSVTTFTVENLKEKSEFYFRVFAENTIGLSFPTTTSLVSLKTHATVPSPPTAPLEVRSVGINSVIVEWGVPESDGGAPLEGYKVAVKDTSKTMWMEVGHVSPQVQKLTIKDLQENHEYLIRIFARNEVGLSEPLESDEPFKVQRPSAFVEDLDMEESKDKETPSLSFTTTTTQSWMREAGMDPDIRTYARSSLLRRSEYFFRIWYYAKHLFK